MDCRELRNVPFPTVWIWPSEHPLFLNSKELNGACVEKHALSQGSASFVLGPLSCSCLTCTFRSPNMCRPLRNAPGNEPPCWTIPFEQPQELLAFHHPDKSRLAVHEFGLSTVSYANVCSSVLGVGGISSPDSVTSSISTTSSPFGE